MSTEVAFRVPPGANKLPDNRGWTNRFEIKSQSSNRVYIVALQASTGIWGCSCPGWRTRRYCKHLRTLGLLTYDPKREVR